ncbi:MAG: hypothetical protein HYR88_18870 [Verrucomicrobia bacterium]|nr:hypothetical protein [Verrucomicrobiota bacterium]MBI3869964.1 hypothetical protein [Verrucomicrobiota bacterium]
MEYFTRKAYEATQAPKGRKAWHQLEKQYTTHLRSINPLLKDGWRSVATQDLSDEVLQVAERPAFDQVILELESHVLILRGVRQARLPEPTVEPPSWICHEIHVVDDDTVELKVLLSEGEIRVTAEEARIYCSDAGAFRRTA